MMLTAGYNDPNFYFETSQDIEKTGLFHTAKHKQSFKA